MLAQDNPGHLLSLQNIRKTFGGIRALKGVSLTLDAGEILALVGENGAGKSTLVKVLTGIYHPEEGQIIESNIYGILRHPVYAGALRVCIGLALLNGNANSIAFTIFVPLGLTGWIRLVEEKELIERFGQSYLDYRKRIPAFWPRLRDMGKFFTFLFTGR